MNRTKILLAIIITGSLIAFGTPLIVNSILGKKILSTLNEKYPDYQFEIEQVQWSFIPSQLTLKKIRITSKAIPGSAKGEISSIQFKGIKNMKALFKKEYEIKQIIVKNTTFYGLFSWNKKEKIPIISTLNVHIGNLLFDHMNLSLKDSSSAQTINIKEGELNLMNLEIQKYDTLSTFREFDFKAAQIFTASPDSMYTFSANGIVYSDTTKTLSVAAIKIDPNYKGYEFTSRYTYETDCIKALLSDLNLTDFSADDFINSGNLKGSYLSIGNMDIDVFRDKRKKDNQQKKPVFQQYIYDYPGLLQMDSIAIADGNIVYSEHAEKAKERGIVNFSKFNARIYNIINDTIYKNKDTSMTMIAEAFLMGKSKMTLSLKAKLFDPLNTFSMKGTLAGLDVRELNPILEKNAFVYANSAKIEKMNFHFTANDHKAFGEMIMLYNGLDIAIKNKRTNDTTGFKEKLVSLIVNKGAWDSNPLPSEEVRVGIIDYERDPSKFIFNYCLKSILTGVKSSIIKHPKRKKSFLQRIFTDGSGKQKDALQN